MVRNSPASTSKVTPFSALTISAPIRNSRLMSCSSSIFCSLMNLVLSAALLVSRPLSAAPSSTTAAAASSCGPATTRGPVSAATRRHKGTAYTASRCRAGCLRLYPSDHLVIGIQPAQDLNLGIVVQPCCDLFLDQAVPLLYPYEGRSAGLGSAIN